jgi:predicted enzyme related to lactoylglutathione lyase
MCAQRGPKAVAETGSSEGRFVWYELSSTDPRGAIAFYKRVLGWDAADASGSGPAYSFFLSKGTPVAGLMALPQNARRMGAAPQWTGYVAVSDVDKAASRAKSLGATILMPPTDVPNVSRFCVIGDPEMATMILSKGLGQSAQAPQPQHPPPSPVIWHELNAARPQKAFDFFSELVGWQKAELHQNSLGFYQEFAIANEPAGGIISKPDDWERSFWRYYFQVDGIEAATKRVVDAGGKVYEGTILLPNGSRIAYCSDPYGALFGLMDVTVRIKVGCYVAQEPQGKKPPKKP